MAEELYFIKTNPIVAKINLYNTLCREEESVLDYIKSDPAVNLDAIKLKLKSSVDELSSDEFFSIFYWIHHKHSLDHPYNTEEYRNNIKEIENQLFINGLDYFYEIPSKTPVRKFHEILSDYTCSIETDFEFIINSKNFNQFLVYGIFYTALTRMFTDQYYYKNEADNDLIITTDLLKTEHKNLYDLAQNEFNSNLKSHEEFISGHEKLLEFRRIDNYKTLVIYPEELQSLSEKEDDLLNTGNAYYHFCELYELTKFHHGNIVCLHSY